MNPYVSLILQYLLPPLATLFVAALIAVAHAIAKKYGLESSLLSDGKLDSAIQKGVGFAEEWALNKSKIDPSKMPSSSDKLTKAIEFAKAEMDRLGLEQLAEQKIEDLIHAHLGNGKLNSPMLVQGLASELTPMAVEKK